MMRRSAGSLPPLTGDALTHSEHVQAHIRRVIDQAGGMISFETFMDLALYAPGLGYYVSGAAKFGEAGDFVTAPEISTLFGRCLARQCAQVLENLGNGDLLELGAGSGRLALTLFRELDRLGVAPHHYFILEVSAELQQRQRALFAEQAPELLPRVCWLQGLPEKGFNGVVVANEVVDAMPVHRVRLEQEVVYEYFVGWSNERFHWLRLPSADPVLVDYIQGMRRELDEAVFAGGYTSEVNLRARAWLTTVARMLERGVMLIVDYGFPRHEYYHPDRHMGTLMCHFRHRAHTDPFVHVGMQDITAHVDFTSLAEVAVENGLDLGGYTTQAHFLIGCGIDTMLAESGPAGSRESVVLAQEIKKLTLASEMGELFKVLAVQKALDLELLGFRFTDLRGKL